MNKKKKNYTFIDGQNLYMGTAKLEINPWKIDLKRFYLYLKQKYNVDKAYYFLRPRSLITCPDYAQCATNTNTAIEQKFETYCEYVESFCD